MRFIAIGIGIFAALLLVLYLTLSYKGDEIIREASFGAGNDIIGAPVIINDLSLNPFSGTLSIKNFSVGQPQGFGEEESFFVKEFFIDLDSRSLFSNHLEVEMILIDQPALTLVLEGGESNFGRMQENVDRALGNVEASDDNGKVTLHDFYLNNTQLKIISDQFGEHDVVLADIHLTDIGVEEDGVAPSEIFRHAMDAIKPQIGKALLELGIKNKLTQEFDARIGDRLNKELDKLPEPLKDAADTIGGLLKKKKPKENENI